MLSRDVIDRFRRERSLLAVAESVDELGPNQVTVADITRRGRMSRNTFYDQFENVDDAFAQAVDFFNARLRGAIDAAADCEGTWAERVGRIIAALLTTAAVEPAAAKLALVYGHARRGTAGPFEPALVATLAGILRPGRRQAASVPPPRTEELVALGILSVIGNRLRSDEASTLTELGEQLTTLAVLMFLDPKAELG